jgi:2-polyprenyl-6-methoxyphenol hydroxylase-like FAD-dependent oxidoreductase
MGKTQMTNLIARDAVVIGAGIGGLAAAKAVAPYFDNVIVLDRDVLPDEFISRAGTPQARHAHMLLAGGQRALTELFPGIDADLMSAGAIRTQVGRDVMFERPGYDPFPRRDLSLEAFSMSRSLLEVISRRRLGQERNIQVRSGSRVIELVASFDRRAIGAVRYGDSNGEQEIPADIVVDASGRARPTLSFLGKSGFPKPAEAEIGVDLGYASAIFEIPAYTPRDWLGLAHFPALPNEARGGLILPIEHGRWIVSLVGVHGDAPPTEIERFRAFAESFRTRTFFDAISCAKQVGEIARYNLPSSIRRDFRGLHHLPRGLIPLGDSVCRFNPVFGQGMSVAIQEAVILGCLLGSRLGLADPLDGLAQDYLREIQRCLEAPWATAMIDFVNPKTRGERPPDLDKSLRYGAALLRLAAVDPEVHKVMAEVNHLVRPHSALREPHLAARIMALI